MHFKNFYFENILNENSSDENGISVYIRLDNYKNRLINNGWKEIGEGSFATVFEKLGKNYVLKLYISDAGYESFLDFLEQNQNNPHLVKIKRSLIPSRSEVTKIGLVAIEKLKPISRSDWRINLSTSLGRFLTNYNINHKSFDQTISDAKKKVEEDLQSNIENVNISADKKELSDVMKEFIRKQNALHKKTIRRLDYFIETNIDLIKTFYDLKKSLKGNKADFRFDLHRDNFMIRPSTGEIVITDPLADF